VDATPQQIKQVISESSTSGKCITSNDIRNIKAKVKSDLKQGRSEGQFLIDVVRDYMKVTMVVYLIFCRMIMSCMVCFQTSKMRYKYTNYGQVLFVDTTYKLNIEGFPLLVFLSFLY
jgi:hypothetical protein